MTAGPTVEDIDPVRFVSNRSTGRMGYRLAEAARDRGARVVLVSGPTSLSPPAGVDFVAVRSAEEMQRAVERARLGGHRGRDGGGGLRLSARGRVAAQKVKKSRGPARRSTRAHADILRGLGEAKGGRLLVGFAAETDDVVEQRADEARARRTST